MTTPMKTLEEQIKESVNYSGLVSFGTEPEYHYLDDKGRMAEKLIKELRKQAEEYASHKTKEALERVRSGVLDLRGGTRKAEVAGYVQARQDAEDIISNKIDQLKPEEKDNG